MANTNPPQEVLVEFLRVLRETVVSFHETIVPVVRGSLLLRHWFGERARPAADIDLECFERPSPEPADADEEDADEEEYRREGGHGRFGEFDSLVDFGKAMCRYAAISTTYHRWNKRRPPPEIEFERTEASADGNCLWTYGTPGERYFAGWIWHGPQEQRGQLQIDIAQAGSYRLEDVAVADVGLSGPGGPDFDFLAYTPEMMLAAKLSWLLRSLCRNVSGDQVGAPLWDGEPKDLFDAHLLLTQGQLRPALVQKSLLALGSEDGLDWGNLEAIFDARRAHVTDADFHNWDAFRRRHPGLATVGPARLLEEVADRLAPLLGDFHPRDEAPFLMALNADPVDEATHLIYADWLEERGEQRGQFLRLFARHFFRRDEMSPGERVELQTALRETSAPWLLRLFGTSARLSEMKRRIQAD